MTEVWAAVRDFPEYAVSNLGRVKRVQGGRGTRANYVLKQRINRDGYSCVTIQRLRTCRKGYLVNRLVCEAFHGPPPTPEHHAAHNDGIKANNRPENVRWATRIENEADKERHPRARLVEDQVRRIRFGGGSAREVAELFGVSRYTVEDIRQGKRWKSITAKGARL